MYYTYIIQSKTDRKFVYKGITNNIERRLKQHNFGKVKKTKFYCPFNLIHVEITESRVDARKIEKFFKSGYGREIINQIIDNL